MAQNRLGERPVKSATDQSDRAFCRLSAAAGGHWLERLGADVPAASWRLTVLGSQDRDRAYVRRIWQHIATMSWEEQVQLRGLRSQTEIAICLADSDVLAVPTHPESYSIAYLEALSHGLPVMTHAESDSADLVEHGVSGFHMQPYDLVSAAEHLEALAADRARLARMSLAARSRFAGLPSWEQSLSLRVTAALRRLPETGRHRLGDGSLSGADYRVHP